MSGDFDLWSAFRIGLSGLDSELRQFSLRGSDANIIVNGTDADRDLLVAVKRGTVPPPDLRNNLAVVMGTFTEILNAWWYQQVTGIAVYERNTTADHPTVPYLGCSLDGRVDLPSAPRVPWEAKHTSATNLDGVARRYYPQICHNLDVTGAPCCVLSVFMGSNRHGTVTLAHDPAYLARLRERMAVVWEAVETGNPIGTLPEMPTPAAWERPAPTAVVDLASLPAANRIGDMAHVFLSTLAAAKDHAKAKEGLRKEVPDDAAEVFGFGIRGRRNARGALTFVPDRVTDVPPDFSSLDAAMASVAG